MHEEAVRRKPESAPESANAHSRWRWTSIPAACAANGSSRAARSFRPSGVRWYAKATHTTAIAPTVACQRSVVCGHGRQRQRPGPDLLPVAEDVVGDLEHREGRDPGGEAGEAHERDADEEARTDLRPRGGDTSDQTFPTEWSRSSGKTFGGCSASCRAGSSARRPRRRRPRRSRSARTRARPSCRRRRRARPRSPRRRAPRTRTRARGSRRSPRARPPRRARQRPDELADTAARTHTRSTARARVRTKSPSGRRSRTRMTSPKTAESRYTPLVNGQVPVLGRKPSRRPWRSRSRSRRGSRSRAGRCPPTTTPTRTMIVSRSA